MTRGWFPKGSHPVLKHNWTRKKICVFGALGEIDFDSVMSEKLNSEYYIRYLDHLRRKYGKIVIVIDHVKYHVAKVVQKYYRLRKESVHVEYFPSYSPKLNPIEQTWKKVKNWLATRIWFTLEELQEQLAIALNDPFFMTPIYDYLLP